MLQSIHKGLPVLKWRKRILDLRLPFGEDAGKELIVDEA